MALSLTLTSYGTGLSCGRLTTENGLSDRNSTRCCIAVDAGGGSGLLIRLCFYFTHIGGPDCPGDAMETTVGILAAPRSAIRG